MYDQANLSSPSRRPPNRKSLLTSLAGPALVLVASLAGMVVLVTFLRSSRPTRSPIIDSLVREEAGEYVVQLSGKAEKLDDLRPLVLALLATDDAVTEGNLRAPGLPPISIKQSAVENTQRTRATITAVERMPLLSTVTDSRFRVTYQQSPVAADVEWLSAALIDQVRKEHGLSSDVPLRSSIYSVAPNSLIMSVVLSHELLRQYERGLNASMWLIPFFIAIMTCIVLILWRVIGYALRQHLATKRSRSGTVDDESASYTFDNL